MRYLLPVLAALAGLATPPVIADDAAALKRRLETLYPATHFDRVTPINHLLPELFEVAMGRNIIYTNAEAKYFIFGHIYDMERRADLTAEKIAAMPDAPAPKFNSLPFGDSIQTLVRGDGRRRLALFSDPACGYCRKLEAELTKLDNITVHTFLVPVLGPASSNIAARVLCAPDPPAAWRGLMLAGAQPPAQGDCAAAGALDRNLALARSIGMRGTPTYMTESGTIGAGALAAQALDALLGK